MVDDGDANAVLVQAFDDGVIVAGAPAGDRRRAHLAPLVDRELHAGSTFFAGSFCFLKLSSFEKT